MSRKFVGKLIRIMMTKSSSCDILKKKRTIRRGSGSRLKGSYLMDLRFWNYVIPDGSTTADFQVLVHLLFWNYVIPDGSTTPCDWLHQPFAFWNYVIPDGSTTEPVTQAAPLCFGTMSFQMVLLPEESPCALPVCSSIKIRFSWCRSAAGLTENRSSSFRCLAY